MAKPRKSSARSKKKTAGQAKSKAKLKAKKKTPAKARAKGRPAAAPTARTESTGDVAADEPKVVFTCVVNPPPQYEDAPAGLWEKVADIPEFAALLPRGQITISVKPEAAAKAKK